MNEIENLTQMNNMIKFRNIKSHWDFNQFVLTNKLTKTLLSPFMPIPPLIPIPFHVVFYLEFISTTSN